MKKASVCISKKRLFPFLLAVVFVLGCAGRLLLRPSPAPTVPLSLTVCSFPEDNALCRALPLKEQSARLDGLAAHITEAHISPHTLTEIKDGPQTVSYPSALTSVVTLRLSLTGEIRDGHFFAEGVYLPVGKEMVLRTDAFWLRCRILDVRKR